MKTMIRKINKALCALLSLALAAVPFTANADITFVHPDHLGSPIAYTDAEGIIIGREYYTPYGESLNPPTTNDTVSYTGHYRDGDTGLVYMLARYYDPELGRFLSVDPVTFSPDKPQQFNRYWYANGNPYRYTDPNGREPGDFAAGFSMGLVYSEEQAETILAVEAACKVCGSELSDGIQVGQATGTLISEGVSVTAVVAAMSKLDGKRKGNRTTGDQHEKVVIERKKPGRDGANSRITLEKVNGETTSRTHTVTKGDEIIHQHQEHMGKYGTEKTFSDELTGTETINAND